jgi:hypothetical protein
MVVDALPLLVVVGVVPLLLTVVIVTEVDMLPLVLAMVDLAVVTGVVVAVPGRHWEYLVRFNTVWTEEAHIGLRKRQISTL